MSTPKKQNQAYFGLVLATLIIGLSFIFVKIGLRYARAMDLLAHRFTAAAISIVLLWRWLLLRSEEHTSELQSRPHLVCRLLLEKKKVTISIGVLRSAQICIQDLVVVADHAG